MTELPTIDAAKVSSKSAATAEGGNADGNANVAGVLLAAGTSQRFGERNKLLAEIDGEPIVRQAARMLATARVEPVIVVLGHDAERVRTTLDDLPVETVVNHDYERGQALSVRAGIDAVRRSDLRADAAVVALGDMPFVGAGTIDALLRAYETGVGSALAAAYDGQRGNPVLFDRQYFDELAAVSGDVGGREILLDGDDSALVSVGDPGVVRDVDRPSEL